MFDDFTGVVLDIEEGKRIAHALGEHKAVILSNHGLLTVGQHRSTRPRGGSSRWSAPARPSCWPRRPARPVLIDREQAEKTAGQVGSPLAGWFSFQPLYDWITTIQPDLLEA